MSLKESTPARNPDEAPVPTLVKTGLELHNQLRRKHGACPLKLDPRLCLKAQSLAQASADKDTPGDAGPEVGMNVFRVDRESLDDPTQIVQTAINNWYGQEPHYNWASPLTSRSKTNSFCQVVWGSTQNFGIGVAMSGDRKYFSVVSLYSPSGKGGTVQNYKDNVHPCTY